MLRTFVTAVVMASVVFLSTVALAVVQPPEVRSHIIISGRLEWVEHIGSPHYEVAGYVLLHPDQAYLDSLRGQQVLVKGTESTAPSIFMRKAIHVLHIEVVGNPPTPSPDKGGDVTLPVILDPAISLPRPDPEPVPPAYGTPWHGTPLRILFGTLERHGASPAVAVETPAGTRSVPLSHGEDVAWDGLVGERVAVTASPEQEPDGTARYILHDVLPLLTDLAERIHAGSAAFYVAPEHPVSVALRGQPLELQQAPIIGNGRTLLPLRVVAEALGARVDWDQTTRTATVTLEGRSVMVRTGSNRVVIHDQDGTESVILTDVAPVIVSSRTLVPVRVITEGLGLTVRWEPASRTVHLE